MADINQLAPATILHWDFKHFVVLEGVTKLTIRVIDPSIGRLHLSRESFSKHFTGVAILLEPGQGFCRVEKPASKWELLWGAPNQSSTLLKIAVASVLLQCLILAVPLVSGLLVDAAMDPSRNNEIATLTVVAAAAVLLQGVSWFTRSQLLLYLRSGIDSALSATFLHKLLNLPFEFVQQRAGGDLLLRLSSNAYLRETLTSAALSTLLDGAMSLMSLALLFVQSYRAAIAVLFVASVHVASLLFLQRRESRLLVQSLESKGLSQSLLIDTVAGMELLKGMGLESVVSSQWSNLYSRERNTAESLGKLDSTSGAVDTFVRGISSLSILLLALQQLVNSDLSLGGFVALIAIANLFLTSTASLVTIPSRVKALSAYLERLGEVFAASDEDSPEAVPPKNLTGAIILEDLSFRYSPVSGTVVKQISAHIRAGEFVAIVGPSGCGKSTLARLLIGLYKPTSGRVLYDGQDLRALVNSQLRRQIGFVPQQPQLFHGTIRANIALSDPDMPLEEVERAARLAHIHEPIVGMNMGYNTPITSRGGSLSGGEQQRIALARAFARPSRLIVLDEATSALDALAERDIQRELESLACTRIVIAHRLSSVINADRILVMDRGAIVESGTHTELRRYDGVYAKLFASQINGGLA